MFFKAIFAKIRKLPKKILIPVILGLLAIIFFTSRGNQPQRLEFADVKKGDLKQTISASGTLTGKNNASLRFATSGKLAYLLVKAGDRVYFGQSIAGLDAQELSITLQQAENNLRDKTAALDKILDDIHLYQYGNGGFDNVGSNNETMTQRSLRTSAQVAKDNAYDSVQAAKRNLQDGFIFAPFSGLVTQTNLAPGQNVGGSDIVAQVVDDSQIFFDMEVDETDINKITIGQEAEISLDAHPDQIFIGKVNQIIPQVKTTSSGATIIITRILITSNIQPVFGLMGQASVTINQVNNVLSIPLEALREDNSVAIQTPQGLKNIKVEIGIKSEAEVEIKSGLTEGEKVLLNPPLQLPQRQTNPLLRIFRIGGGRGR